MINLNFLTAQELVIGEETIEPGIVFIFEGAIKDHVMPNGMHLNENETNIHDKRIISGESGSAGLAGLIKCIKDPGMSKLNEHIGLNSNRVYFTRI